MRDRVDASPTRGGELSAQDGAGRTVLMVDDDPDVRTSVARGLRHSGFDVRVAATGKEALRLLRPGGVVAFDNALWHDRVADPSVRDDETVAVREMLAAV